MFKFLTILLFLMISREEAESVFQENVLNYHDGLINRQRKEWNFKTPDSWSDYVSLPLVDFISDNKTAFFEMLKGSIVVVHPGYRLGISGWKPDEKYTEVYMKPLKKMIGDVKRCGSKVILYSEIDSLNQRLDIVGKENNIVVPTSDGPLIERGMLGYGENWFAYFLKRNGLEETTVCGENSFGCVKHVSNVLKKFDISIIDGPSYPLI